MRAPVFFGFRTAPADQVEGGARSIRRAVIWGASLILSLQASVVAHAFCVEPTFNTPRPKAPGAYRRPVVPSCLKNYKDTEKHTCEEFEIAAYFDEVNTYIRQLNAYVLKSKNFAEDAASLSKDVLAYAQCEAKEVKGQHK